MKKYVWTVLGIIILLLLTPGLAMGEKTQQEPPPAMESMKKMDLDKMEEFKRKIDGEITGSMSEKSMGELVKDFITGKWSLDFKEVSGNLLKYIAREILANSSLLGKILVLAVISALLINLQSSFENQGIAKLSAMACFLALSAISLGSFKYVLGLGQDCITSMADFMTSILPQMMVLVTGLGHINTATAMFPILMTLSTIMAQGMTGIVFPLIIISAALNLLNTVADTVKVQRLGKLAATLAEIAMGLIMTIFITVLTLKGLYGTVLDKVALKTGKFVTDAFFPVIGGYIADALETAAGYFILLKQAAGIFGMLIVFGTFIFPVLKIGVIAFMYKLVAALVEPIGDARTAQVLEIMGNHLLLVLATVAAVGLMFFIVMAILGSIGNSAILVR
ncbi:MAG: stage III sporulation protein AE [Acidobacteriota bacterium]